MYIIYLHIISVIMFILEAFFITLGDAYGPQLRAERGRFEWLRQLAQEAQLGELDAWRFSSTSFHLETSFKSLLNIL